MTEESQAKVKIGLVTSDPALFGYVAGALHGFEVTGEVGQAALILVDIKGNQFVMPPFLPAGRPIIALTPNRSYEGARAMFLAGAVDVLARNTAVGTLRDAVERCLYGSPIDQAMSIALSSGLFYLREVAQAIGDGANLAWLFQRIVEIVAEALDVDIVSLMLLEFDAQGKKEWLRIKAARGLSEEIVRLAKVEPGEGISGQVAASGEPLMVSDVEQSGFGIVKNNPRYQSKGLLSVPIKARSQTIGVLNVNNKISGIGFDDRDLALLATLCNQAGLAIDNTRLYEDLRLHAASLSGLNEQLLRINRAKSELIVNLSHEIKTPLTAIQGYIDLMKSGLIEPARMQEILGKVHNRSQHLNRLAERLITYFALDSRVARFYFQPFPLEVLVFSCAEEVRGRAENKGIRLEINGESLRYEVYADRQYYREMIVSLLDNAVKFNREDGELRVYGSPTEVDGRRFIELYIQDSGPGVPDHLREAIFDDFKQTDDILTAKPDGLGLGLAIARSVASGHGCRLRLVKTGPEGSVFAVTAPLEAVAIATTTPTE